MGGKAGGRGDMRRALEVVKGARRRGTSCRNGCRGHLLVRKRKSDGVLAGSRVDSEVVFVAGGEDEADEDVDVVEDDQRQRPRPRACYNHWAPIGRRFSPLSSRRAELTTSLKPPLAPVNLLLISPPNPLQPSIRSSAPVQFIPTVSRPPPLNMEHESRLFSPVSLPRTKSASR